MRMKKCVFYYILEFMHDVPILINENLVIVSHPLNVALFLDINIFQWRQLLGRC